MYAGLSLSYKFGGLVSTVSGTGSASGYLNFEVGATVDNDLAIMYADGKIVFIFIGIYIS